MLLVPAIEIRHHRDQRVGDFRLARELRLGRRRHANHRGAEALVMLRLGVGRELRALHADIGSAALHDDALGRRRVRHALAQHGRSRMRERHMGDEPRAEVAGLALEGAVDELVGQHEQAGVELALVGAAGGDGDDVGDAGALERVDIGAIVDRRGRVAMAAAVAGEEHDFGLAEMAETQRVRRFAPGRCNALLACRYEAGKRIEARSADDPDNRLSHANLLTPPDHARILRRGAAKQNPRRKAGGGSSSPDASL